MNFVSLERRKIMMNTVFGTRYNCETTILVQLRAALKMVG